MAVRGTPRRILYWARWLFGPVALLSLALAGWHARSVFAVVIDQTRPVHVLAAAMLWALLHLVTPLFTRIVLLEVGADVAYRTLLGIHVARLPARYLPGGIWHTVSRAMDLHRLGTTRAQLSIMILLENAVPAASALMLGGFALVLTGNATWLAHAAAAAGIAALGITFLLLRHRALRQSRALTLHGYLKLVAVTSFFWLVAATAFYCYWTAFPAARDDMPALQLYGAYLLAWVAGFVTVFAPQGVGVFEYVAGLFLRGALTFGGTAVLVAGFRLTILGADMLAFGIFCGLRLLRERRGPLAH